MDIDACRHELRGLLIEGDPADYEAIREQLIAFDSWLRAGCAPPAAWNLALASPN